MNRNIPRPAERREFGRRWSDVHGWIVVEGRPKLSCQVRNFSKCGALLMVRGSHSLPLAFVLEIEAIDFRIGCQVRHSHEASIGVRFISPDLVGEIGPVWTIDELMSQAAAREPKLAS